jgi:hypothetical protein
VGAGREGDYQAGEDGVEGDVMGWNKVYCEDGVEGGVMGWNNACCENGKEGCLMA